MHAAGARVRFMDDRSDTSAMLRDVRDVKVVIATAVGVFLLSACVTSRFYWGYWFTPPASDRTAGYLSDVTSFTSFWRSTALSGGQALYRAANQVTYVSGDSPAGRLPAALVKRGLLAASDQPIDASVLRVLIEAMAERGLLRRGDPGYERATELEGHVVIGKDQSGKEIVVAALVGGEVSNDHRPYYEVVAEQVSDGKVTIKRSRFYWWDLAGGEGLAHWLGGIVATIAWLVGAGIFFAVRRRVRDARERSSVAGRAL